jgi:hypothetical protein
MDDKSDIFAVVKEGCDNNSRYNYYYSLRDDSYYRVEGGI